jgi:hypothetical protein
VVFKLNVNLKFLSIKKTNPLKYGWAGQKEFKTECTKIRNFASLKLWDALLPWITDEKEWV